MQIFLPYSNFTKTAKCLDNKRLGNQCYRECKVLLNGGWKHHPASKMWANHKYALCKYAMALAEEMEHRNQKAILEGKKTPWKIYIPGKWWRYYALKMVEFKDNGLPDFIDNKDFHESHKSNLLRKDPEWYGQFGWKVRDDLSYVWHTKLT